jgi:hypothetical protein
MPRYYPTLPLSACSELVLPLSHALSNPPERFEFAIDALWHTAPLIDPLPLDSPLKLSPLMIAHL